ncbi:MAG: 16S rRNA (guanine(527)-N(7))-methyltransferase RsmG [Clostridia bacterium]|nr:16S rRNA (guanine(527)-N(7))-methyltransferase RsmG [Clostridia bacterium]
MMDLLFREAEKNGLVLNDDQLEKFQKYMDFLLEYNLHTNLTAITDSDDVMIKHFFDSIIINKFLDIRKNAKVVDIGTGAGFPGVPMKIFREDIELTLIDSLNKRVVFLNQLMEKLSLSANIFHARAEELGHKKEYREVYDLAVSRAVAPLNILCELSLPYVKKGGYFVSLKGSNAQEEINKSKKAIEILGGKLEIVKTLELPENKGLRNILIIKKVSNTPIKYPRNNSQISKSPL